MLALAVLFLGHITEGHSQRVVIMVILLHCLKHRCKKTLTPRIKIVRKRFFIETSLKLHHSLHVDATAKSG